MSTPFSSAFTVEGSGAQGNKVLPSRLSAVRWQSWDLHLGWLPLQAMLFAVCYILILETGVQRRQEELASLGDFWLSFSSSHQSHYSLLHNKAVRVPGQSSPQSWSYQLSLNLIQIRMRAAFLESDWSYSESHISYILAVWSWRGCLTWVLTNE